MIQTALSNPVHADSIIEGEEADVLNNITSPDCSIAIYLRQPEATLQEWLDTIPPEKLPKARLTLQKDKVKDAMVTVFSECSIADNPNSQILAEDINSLAQLFAKIMKTNSINLRLDVVNDNACRKFHQDNVAARLLCSYRGRGTEYGIYSATPMPDVIYELPKQAVGIFKGRRWTPAPSTVIYHRSPPIEGSGETRLLLVIDKASSENNCDCC
ncbi:MAG: DUF1826 domain-containing protein [Emcibacteraceae bacterium]